MNSPAPVSIDTSTHLAAAVNERIRFANDNLTFIAESHTYLTSDGTVVPSVTQILNYVFGQSVTPQVSQELLEFKAAVGTATHKICHIIDSARITPQEAITAYLDDVKAEFGSEEAEQTAEWLTQHVMPYVMAYTRFLRAVHAQWLWSEEMVYRQQTINGLPGYAGRFDRIGVMIDVDSGREIPCIADIKTSAKISPVAVYQLAAYLDALGISKDIPVGCIIKLEKSRNFSVTKYDITERHVKLFHSFTETFHAVHSEQL